jgi:hypothetical protein
MTPGRFLELARANPVNAALLDRLPALGLPQGHLVAGCLFQAVWNAAAGRPPAAGLRDYDIFYFDAADLSWEAEDAVIRRVRAVTADLGARVEIRNQARVHLWYEARFGVPRAPLGSAREGIGSFLVACTCVGVALASGELHAPDGLADLAAGRLRPNPLSPAPGLFRAKAEDYRARWPFLTIEA